MKIAQVSFRYYPYIGGVEEHVRNISERLARDHDVSVLTTDPSGDLPREETLKSVKIKRFDCWAPNNAYYFSEHLRKYLRKVSSDFDIVHAHNYASFPAFYAAKAKSKNKFVFTPHYHGGGHTLLRSLLHFPYRFIGKGIFERADKVVCVSRYEKSLITRDFVLDQEKMVVIPNGVNMQEFASLRRKRSDQRVILYVGRLEKYKGVQYLLRVLPRLSSDVILEIVGKGTYEKRLFDLARELNVYNRVMFARDLPRTELLRKYAEADVFVLLSKHEAYGITVAEALAAGVPCVVARASALSQWVDGVSCFGIDYPMNLGELAGVISDAMRANVHKMVLPNWDEIAERTASLYELLLSSRGQN